MITVFDVAKYILQKCGSMSTYKLQKLVYYSQAWSLVWNSKPLFPERIEAWANGPVVRELFDVSKGLFTVEPGMFTAGRIGNLGTVGKKTIDAIIDYYGGRSSQWLSDLTHLERPWIEARERAGAIPGQKCEEEISLHTMYDYYSGITAKNN
jgi:uncharacterized phage-associated protein